MICAARLSLPMRYYSLSVFILVKARDALMSCNQSVYFPLGMNTVQSGYGCPNPYKSCICQYDLILRVCGVIGGHLVSVVHGYAKV